ncbi:hypothetical protein QQ020_32120 [Fulvivirgaceae bacterium BMA12]|uniref:Lipoprotein n=1 Tax=Agaribacillus aureus TaxID=3051825 RepID=A0ABT8LI95_9BACT|nr:hypothetical protein [Fulvivirgaceae bacterium BMA12]
MQTNFIPMRYRLFLNPTPLLLALLITMLGCKSQQNVVKSKDGKLSVDKETVIRDLNNIIDPESELTNEEKTALLKAIKDHGFQDAQVDSLIIEAENALYATAQNTTATEYEEPADATVEDEKDPLVELEDLLTDQFKALANPMPAVDSEDIISETLNYFESNDSPVLIILQKLDGKTFYDRPTTIEKYLYYLKDLKRESHQIEEVNLNTNDKINKLILASY